MLCLPLVKQSLYLEVYLNTVINAYMSSYMEEYSVLHYKYIKILLFYRMDLDFNEIR
jgi:hypothetical protein